MKGAFALALLFAYHRYRSPTVFPLNVDAARGNLGESGIRVGIPVLRDWPSALSSTVETIKRDGTSKNLELRLERASDTVSGRIRRF